MQVKRNHVRETGESVDVGVDPQAAVTAGVGLGSVLAIVCSWERHKSIFWAILAGWLSWFYVIWFALTRNPDETKLLG